MCFLVRCETEAEFFSPRSETLGLVPLRSETVDSTEKETKRKKAKQNENEHWSCKTKNKKKLA
jgi:hypothetical protein